MRSSPFLLCLILTLLQESPPFVSGSESRGKLPESHDKEREPRDKLQESRDNFPEPHGNLPEPRDALSESHGNLQESHGKFPEPHDALSGSRGNLQESRGESAESFREDDPNDVEGIGDEDEEADSDDEEDGGNEDEEAGEDDEDGAERDDEQGDDEEEKGEEAPLCDVFNVPKLEAMFCESFVNKKGVKVRRCAVQCAQHYHSAELGDNFGRNENFYTVYDCDERSGVWTSPASGTKYELRCQKEGCTKPYGEDGTKDGFNYQRVQCSKLIESPAEIHYSYCTVQCAPGYFAYQSGSEQGKMLKQQVDCIEGRYQIAEGSDSRLQCSQGGKPFGVKNPYQDAYGMSTFCQYLGSFRPNAVQSNGNVMLEMSRASACEPTCSDDLNIVRAQGSPFDTAKLEFMNGQPTAEPKIRCEQGALVKAPQHRHGYITKCDDSGRSCMFRCDERAHYIRTRPGVFGDKDLAYVRLGRWTYEFSPMQCAPRCRLFTHARAWHRRCPHGTGTCQGINDKGEHFCWHKKLNNSGIDASQVSMSMHLGDHMWTAFWEYIEKKVKAVYEYVYKTTSVLDNKRKD